VDKKVIKNLEIEEKFRIFVTGINEIFGIKTGFQEKKLRLGKPGFSFFGKGRGLCDVHN